MALHPETVYNPDLNNWTLIKHRTSSPKNTLNSHFITSHNTYQTQVSVIHSFHKVVQFQIPLYLCAFSFLSSINISKGCEQAIILSKSNLPLSQEQNIGVYTHTQFKSGGGFIHLKFPQNNSVRPLPCVDDSSSLPGRFTTTSFTKLSRLNHVLIHGGIPHSTYELWPWIRVLDLRQSNCFTQFHFCHTFTSVRTHLKKSSSPDSYKDVISQRLILRPRVSHSKFCNLSLHRD